MMLDEKIIQLYQWIVDTTEKKPQWLAKQVAMVYLIPEAMARIVGWESGWDAVWLLVTMVVAGSMVYATYDESLFKVFGDSPWARPVLLCVIISQLATFAMVSSGRSFLFIIGGIGMLSYYGFAACEGPRPKKRKEKLVLDPT